MYIIGLIRLYGIRVCMLLQDIGDGVAYNDEDLTLTTSD